MQVTGRKRQRREQAGTGRVVAPSSEKEDREHCRHPEDDGHRARDAVVKSGPQHCGIEQKIHHALVVPGEPVITDVSHERRQVDVLHEPGIRVVDGIERPLREHLARPRHRQLFIGTSLHFGKTVVFPPKSQPERTGTHARKKKRNDGISHEVDLMTPRSVKIGTWSLFSKCVTRGAASTSARLGGRAPGARRTSW